MKKLFSEFHNSTSYWALGDHRIKTVLDLAFPGVNVVVLIWYNCEWNRMFIYSERTEYALSQEQKDEIELRAIERAIMFLDGV